MLQKLLIIFKSMHEVHHTVPKDQTVHQPKCQTGAGVFWSWTPTMGFISKYCSVCKKNVHVLCSQDTRHWVQIWYEGIKLHLANSNSHVTVTVTVSLSRSICWSVIVANLLALYYSLGRAVHMEEKTKPRNWKQWMAKPRNSFQG